MKWGVKGLGTRRIVGEEGLGDVGVQMLIVAGQGSVDCERDGGESGGQGHHGIKSV